MKKVLIGLLVLAVAGGGVFAQEWRFSGEMRTGLGLFFGEEVEEPEVRMLTDDPNAGTRAQLRTQATNADGTAGLDFMFRAQGGASPADVTLPHGFGWINFMDNMITLQGGRIDDAAGFNSFDRMAGARMGEGTGLRTLIRPMDGLVFNLGLFGHPSAAGDRVGVLGFEPNAYNDGQIRAVFAVRYEEPDLFRFVVGGRTANSAFDQTSGFDGWTDDGVALGYHDHSSAAYFSFEYLGLAGDGIHIAASAFFLNLEEFGDDGFMFFYGSFGHNALVDGMDLTAGVGFGMSQNEIHDDFYLWIWGSVAYRLSDMVVPRLDLHYVMGGATSGELQTMHPRNVARGGASFHSDDSFVRIQPAVQFQVQANTFFEVGAVFNIDLGDNPTWFGMEETGVRGAVYALMRVAF